MHSLSELCEQHKLNINQILKMITASKDYPLLLQITTRVYGLSKTGFLPLDKSFVLELELATRKNNELKVDAEIIFSSEMYMENDISYFKPSKLHPDKYCNILCETENVIIGDIILFHRGGDVNATAEDKKISGADKLKTIDVNVTADVLYVEDVDQLLNNSNDDFELAIQAGKLPLGLKPNDIKMCLDPTHPHYNLGIPLTILNWVKNHRDGTFNENAEIHMANLDTTIKQLILEGHLNSEPKAITINGAAALSVSGSVKAGRKKRK